MNKMIRMLCAGAALAVVLTASAFAAEFTGCAARLEELGLFRGTESGYALDRAPTRGEAAAMLVRLLGKENEAMALSYSAPFTDLAEWHKPYVQYLYENGLANGAGATVFAPNSPCTAQMYAAFLLRALGYDEGAGDFAYADAVDAARTRGIYPPAVVDPSDFRRDDVAAASYTALSLPPKNGARTLLDRLVEDGAAAPEAAAKYQALFTQYAAYRAQTAETDAALSVRCTYADGTAFSQEGAAAQPALTIGGEALLEIDRAAGTIRTEGVVELGAAGAQSTAVSVRRELSEGLLRCSVNGVDGVAEPLSAHEQAQLLAAYAPVPLVYVEQMQQAGGSWSLQLGSMPAPYASLLWAAESALGGTGGAQYEAVVLTHRVSGGRITAQELSAQMTQDGLRGEVKLVSRSENGA